MTNRPTRLPHEVQQLSVELGQTVQAGQLIAELSNHSASVCRWFTRLNVRRDGWNERLKKVGPSKLSSPMILPKSGPPVDQQFQIRHLSNTIDAGKPNV